MNLSKKAEVSAADLYIFQFPAITGLRIHFRVAELSGEPVFAEALDQLEVGPNGADGLAALLDSPLFGHAKIIGRHLQVLHVLWIDAHDSAASRVDCGQIGAHHEHPCWLGMAVDRTVA